MKAAKCPSCGASIVVDESKEAGICEYWNTAYITEKAIAYINNSTTNNAHTIINNYYNTPPKGTVKNRSRKTKKTLSFRERYENRLLEIPRPKEYKFALIILYCYFYFPGLLYKKMIKKLQQDWDRLHGKNNS